MPNFQKIFWIPVVTAFSLFVFKRQMQNFISPIFILVCKDADNPIKLLERSDKAGIAFYKFLVYVGSSIIGYFILKDSEILPWYLGGSGLLKNCWTNVPY